MRLLEIFQKNFCTHANINSITLLSYKLLNIFSNARIKILESFEFQKNHSSKNLAILFLTFYHYQYLRIKFWNHSGFKVKNSTTVCKSYVWGICVKVILVWRLIILHISWCFATQEVLTFCYIWDLFIPYRWNRLSIVSVFQ